MGNGTSEGFGMTRKPWDEPNRERSVKLELATDTEDQFEPDGAIPLNDETMPDDSLLQKIRDGLDHLKTRNGRK